MWLRVLGIVVAVIIGGIQIALQMREQKRPVPEPVPKPAPVIPQPVPQPKPQELVILEPPRMPREWFGPRGMFRYLLEHDGTHFDLYVVRANNVLERVGSGSTNGRTLTFENFYSPVYSTWGNIPHLEMRGNQMIGRAPDGSEQVYLVR